MEISFTLEYGLSLLGLGLLAADRVALLATLALESGADNVRIRQLAGRCLWDNSRLATVLVEALGDAGVRLPARDAAARHIATAVSSEIVRERVDPLNGASYLAEISRAVGSNFHELDPFIYAASEAEDRPSDRE